MQSDENPIGGEKIQSKHITNEKAPPITDLEGAYGVYQRLQARMKAAVKGRDPLQQPSFGPATVDRRHRLLPGR